MLRYAAVYKPDSKPLAQFIQRKGGIMNALLASLGGWGGVVQPGRRDVRNEDDEATGAKRHRLTSTRHGQ